METLVKLAQGFIKLFQTGGENLMERRKMKEKTQ